MTDARPAALTADEIAALREEHRPKRSFQMHSKDAPFTEYSWCRRCGVGHKPPCRVVRALATLDAQAAEIERLRRVEQAAQQRACPLMRRLAAWLSGKASAWVLARERRR